MRIRLSSVISFFTAIFLLLSPLTANAAIKAGSPCSKAGVTKTVGSNKLVCKKSGKKLVWKVKKVAKPSNSDNASGSSDEGVDNSWYSWSFRLNDGELQRRGGPVTHWSNEATRIWQVIDPIRAAAFTKIKEYQAQAAAKPLNINMSFAPNVPGDVAELYRTYFSQSQDYFASRIPDGNVLEVVIATEKDHEWRKAKMYEVMPTEYEANEIYTRETPYFDMFRGPNAIRYSGGGAVTGTSDPKKNVYSGFICSCFKPENILMYNVPHELTHAYQYSVTPTIPKQNFRTVDGKLTEGKIYLPQSLIEGSANTFGAAILVKHVGWYSDLMNWDIGRYKRSSNKPNITDIAEAIQLLNESESYLPRTGVLQDFERVIGQLAYEYFVATYGVKAYLDLFDNVYKLRDFDLAIKETIGITKAEFYQAAAPYVLAAFSSVNR